MPYFVPFYQHKSSAFNSFIFTVMPEFCTGCLKSFSFSGYKLHGQRTNNPRCAADYQQSQQLARGSGGLSESDIEFEEDAPGSPTAFQGDYFSEDYHEDDFNLQNDDGLDTMGDSEPRERDDDLADDSSAEDEDEDSESIFEPVHHLHPPLPLPDDIHDDRPRTLSPPAAEQDAQVEENRQKIYVEKFTRGHAGAPTKLDEISDNNRYKNSLRDPHNLYAPFASKVDWDFARWAKLRGPSSTAVSELLAVDGVSFFFFAKRSRIYTHN